VLLFRRPKPGTIRDFIAAQCRLDLTYQAVGSAGSTLPSGYVVDHTRVRLGEGESVFRAARTAMMRWEHFTLGWARAEPNDTPIQVGAVVAVVARVMGLWWLNASRVVYTIDESGPVSRFGFAYGTLPGHAESGEERFLIEWNTANKSVWYDTLAFSRPNHFLARLGYPFARRTQRRYDRGSAAAMRMAIVQSESH
jgi:uncharacterized protein (UPF0548 family)